MEEDGSRDARKADLVEPPSASARRLLWGSGHGFADGRERFQRVFASGRHGTRSRGLREPLLVKACAASLSDVAAGDDLELSVFVRQDSEGSTAARFSRVCAVGVADGLRGVGAQHSVTEDLAVELHNLHPLIAVRALADETDCCFGSRCCAGGFGHALCLLQDEQGDDEGPRDPEERLQEAWDLQSRLGPSLLRGLQFLESRQDVARVGWSRVTKDDEASGRGAGLEREPPLFS